MKAGSIETRGHMNKPSNQASNLDWSQTAQAKERAWIYGWFIIPNASNLPAGRGRGPSWRRPRRPVIGVQFWDQNYRVAGWRERAKHGPALPFAAPGAAFDDEEPPNCQLCSNTEWE